METLSYSLSVERHVERSFFRGSVAREVSSGGGGGSHAEVKNRRSLAFHTHTHTHTSVDHLFQTDRKTPPNPPRVRLPFFHPPTPADLVVVSFVFTQNHPFLVLTLILNIEHRLLDRGSSQFEGLKSRCISNRERESVECLNYRYGRDKSELLHLRPNAFDYYRIYFTWPILLFALEISCYSSCLVFWLWFDRLNGCSFNTFGVERRYDACGLSFLFLEFSWWLPSSLGHSRIATGGRLKFNFTNSNQTLAKYI